MGFGLMYLVIKQREKGQTATGTEKSQTRTGNSRGRDAMMKERRLVTQTKPKRYVMSIASVIKDNTDEAKEDNMSKARQRRMEHEATRSIRRGWDNNEYKAYRKPAEKSTKHLNGPVKVFTQEEIEAYMRGEL